jgi:hypothetical protein
MVPLMTASRCVDAVVLHLRSAEHTIDRRAVEGKATPRTEVGPGDVITICQR